MGICWYIYKKEKLAFHLRVYLCKMSVRKWYITREASNRKDGKEFGFSPLDTEDNTNSTW